MNFEKPISEQLPALPNAQAIQNSVASSLNSVSNAVANVQDSINTTLSEFSSKSAVDASQDFLNSNSIIAKFVFIILVLIAFMFFVNLGVTLIGYFMKPTTNPYLVNGMIDGNSGIVITQDPKNTNSATIVRSNNQSTGIEFTWSVWLLITANSKSPPTYHNIFNKGDGNYDGKTGIANVNNAPGLYVTTDNSSNNVLRVVMDTVAGSNQTMDITGIPMNKWFHVALRLENKVLDAYVNGTVYQRMTLTAVPKQNYYDVNVCQNGGFVGKLSNLRYFDHALSAFDINNVVSTGANTSTSNLALKSSFNSNAYYLSNLWYSKQ